jgi:ribonuclease HI
MNRIVYIYADESCLGNARDRGTPGGAAGLVEYWTGDRWERRDYWLSEPATTNNRMAIRSAIDGLRAMKAPARVIFTSDSQYLIKGMREWVRGWIRRGWKRQGGAVENVELWQELVEVAGRHEVDWRWVRGHAGHPQNEYANDLAILAAKKQHQSGGLTPSGFAEWLEQEREKDRYLDFYEFAPPPAAEKFSPAAPARGG